MNNEKSLFATAWFWGTVAALAVAVLLIPAAVRFYMTRPSVQQQSALRQAQEAMTIQDTKHAQELLLGAVETDPSSSEAYSMLLEVYAADDNYAAINSLLASLPGELSPEDQLTLRKSGIEYISKAAVRSISAKDYESAIALYQSIISVSGGDEKLSAPARYKIGELQALIDQDKLYNASAQPAASENTLISQARRASGEEAVELWNQVIGENPQYVEGYSAIADIYAYLQEYAKALDILRTGYDLTGDTLLEEKTELIQRQMAKAGYFTATDDTSQNLAMGDETAGDASSENGSGEIQGDNESVSDGGNDVASGNSGTGNDNGSGDGSGSTNVNGSSNGSGANNENDLLTQLTKALNTSDYVEAIRLMARSDFQNTVSTQAEASGSDTISISRASYSARTGTSFLAEAGSDESSELLSELVEKTTEETDDTVLFEVYLDRVDKTFLVYAGDGTELNVYWPAVTDEIERTVIGIYGKDRFGYGTYVLSDGRTLSAVEYFSAFSP